jgi:thiamine biosynthesis protein ThiS
MAGINIMLNGLYREVTEGTTIATLLTELELPRPRVAIEYNGKVLPKDDPAEVTVKEGDQIEIVEMVGGG